MQEYVELVVFGLIALLVGTGLLWLLGWVLSLGGIVLKGLAGLLWMLLRFIVPVAIAGGLVYFLVKAAQDRQKPAMAGGSGASGDSVTGANTVTVVGAVTAGGAASASEPATGAAVAGAVSDVAAAASDAADAAASSVAEAVEVVSDAVDEAANAASETVDEAANAASEAIDEAVDDILAGQEDEDEDRA